MSMSSTGGTGGEIESILKQMIEQTLNNSQVSSAGGDSPKINKFITLGEAAGFGEILDSAVRSIVEQSMEERGAAGERTTNESGLDDEGSSVKGREALGVTRKGIGMAQNPQSIVTMGLAMLPHAVLVSFVISLIPLIINELTRPGGPYDLRFKRVVEKEFNSLMDRQTLHDISIGERGVIFQSRTGFINKNGQSSNTNSLRMIREGGVNKDFLNEVDYVDHSRGLF